MIEFDYKGERMKMYQPGVYGDGTPAWHVVAKETGEPIAVITVCVPGSKLQDDEILVKGWSENEQIFKHLVKLGILEPTGRLVLTGFVSAAVCKLRPPAA